MVVTAAVMLVMAVVGGGDGRASTYDVYLESADRVLSFQEHSGVILQVEEQLKPSSPKLRKGFSTVQRMKKADGTEYECMIPAYRGAHLFENEAQRLQVEEQAAFKIAAEGPHLIAEALGNRCLILETGWWTYEYCHGKHFRQYHHDPKTDTISPTTNFYLGRIVEDAERSRTREEVRLVYYLRGEPVKHDNGTVSRSKDEAHLEVRYKNGDFCEGIRKERTSLVRFKCLPTAEYPSFAVLQSAKRKMDPHVMFVEEVSLCSYTLDIGLAALCDFLQPVREKMRVLPDLQQLACIPV
ncbi:Glucosidase II beta subunit-like protein [Diplonema papillatum]|nr:Glucosidase II beta subunit-like protein [Diplonema papillatum]